MSGPVADQGLRRPTLADANRLAAAEFVALVGSVFEASPWVAESVQGQRPFAGVDALHRAMAQAVAVAPIERQLALIRAHPDLAGRAAIAGELTAESTREQAAAGLSQLTPEQHARLTALNDRYRARFGFPFVICAREHTAQAIIDAAAVRVDAAPDDERATALAEIAKIAALRLHDLISDPETP